MANTEHDLADDFGAWIDAHSEDDLVGEAVLDSEDASDGEEDLPPGVERLVGTRRRWAPQKGTIVELSSQAVRVLASEPAKFFAGQGTIEYVSLDQTEVQVIWKANPGHKLSYPTGYKGKFYLRMYVPPVVADIKGPEQARPQRSKKNISQLHSAEQLAEIRARREKDRNMRVKKEQENSER